MRKQTLAGVCLMLALAIVFLLKLLARAQGIDLPFIGFVSPVIASFIMAPLVLIPSAAVNQYILV